MKSIYALAIVASLHALSISARRLVYLPPTFGQGKKTVEDIREICKDSSKRTIDAFTKTYDFEVGQWFVEMIDQPLDNLNNSKSVVEWFNTFEGASYSAACSPIRSCTYGNWEEDCLASYKTALVGFNFESISNFNGYLGQISDAVSESRDSIDQLLPSFREWFTESHNNGDVFNKIMGVMGAIAGITSIVQPEIGGIEAGVLGFISAIAGLMADKEEEPFKSYAKLSEGLGSNADAIIDALDSFSRYQVTDPQPGRNWHDFASDPHGMPQLISKGAFVKPRTVSKNDPRVKGALAAPIINAIWASEMAFIGVIRPSTFAFDVCDKNNGVMVDNIWCDSDGTAYLLAKFKWGDGGTEENLTSLKGIEKLEKFGLHLRTVILASKATQERTNKFLAEADNKDMINRVTGATDYLDYTNLVFFSLPLCVLEGEMKDEGSRGKADYVALQFIDCTEKTIGDSRWPYSLPPDSPENPFKRDLLYSRV